MDDWQDHDPRQVGWKSWAAVGLLSATVLIAAAARNRETQDLPKHQAQLAKAVDAAFNRSSVPYLCEELDRVTKALAANEEQHMATSAPAPCSIPHAPTRSAM